MKSYEDAKRYYQAGVEGMAQRCSRLWVAAMRMHRCVNCAVMDLNEKVAITRDLVEKSAGVDCPEFCKDQGWVATVAPHETCGSGGVSGHGARGSSGGKCVMQALEVSLLVGEAFDAALALTQCRDCAWAMVMKYIERAAEVTRRHIPEGGGREGFRRGCKRCCSTLQGLV
jgi:hypothetical protein